MSRSCFFSIMWIIILVIITLIAQRPLAFKSPAVVHHNYFIRSSSHQGLVAQQFLQRDDTAALSPTPQTFDLSKEIIDANRKIVSPSESDQKATWIARAALIIVSAFYGTNFGCVKILEDALDPSVAAVLRFSLAGLVFSPFLAKVWKSNPALIKGGLEVGVYTALGYLAQAQALLTTSASTAAFICSLAVVVVPLLDMAFGNDKASKTPMGALKTLFPALLAAVGVASLELGGVGVPGVGDVWALMQPFLFGLGFWRVERHMKLCTAPGEAQAYTGACLLVVALFSILWSAHDFVLPVIGDRVAFTTAVNHQVDALSDWHVTAAIAWTGLVTTALTVFCENECMKRISAAESTVIYSTEPLWGTAFAYVTLGEAVGWNTFVGAILIVSACVWSTVGPRLFGLLPTADIITTGEGMEEVVENFGINWNELFARIGVDSSDFLPPSSG